MREIAKLMANEPKTSKGPRTAVVTMGSNPVFVAKTGDPKVLEFPVSQLTDEQIVDTNGAGDAFTGGFLSQFIQDKPLETCMKCAIYCATECIQRLGCAFPKENKFVPWNSWNIPTCTLSFCLMNQPCYRFLLIWHTNPLSLSCHESWSKSQSHPCIPLLSLLPSSSNVHESKPKSWCHSSVNIDIHTRTPTKKINNIY